MGTLFVVATPIGNLSDVSIRTQETLASVDVILCEDTRVTSKLLASLGIKKPLRSYHQHSEDRVTQEIFLGLKEGKNFALVTDAGTPGISDPGGKLVEQITSSVGKEAVIVPIPGPCAATAALSVCGFPTDEFIFLGFPPVKKGRQTWFDRLAAIATTVVFYESTHRIEKTLQEIEKREPARLLCLCRELTKLHETTYRGTTTEILKQLMETSTKGEFVIVLKQH